MLKMLSLVLTLSSTTAHAGGCDQLEYSVRNDPHSRYVKTLAMYSCGPEFQDPKGPVEPLNACLLAYESKSYFGDKPNSTVLAYGDLVNRLKVPWIIRDGEQRYSGWEESGAVYCGDIKTYAKVNLQNPSKPNVQIILARAFDNMFCPGKIYLSYNAVCKPVSRWP